MILVVKSKRIRFNRRVSMQSRVDKSDCVTTCHRNIWKQKNTVIRRIYESKLWNRPKLTLVQQFTPRIWILFYCVQEKMQMSNFLFKLEFKQIELAADNKFQLNNRGNTELWHQTPANGLISEIKNEWWKTIFVKNLNIKGEIASILQQIQCAQ